MTTPKRPTLVPGMVVEATFELNQSGLLEVPATSRRSSGHPACKSL